MPASEETGSGPVIHDNRRIDPVTGRATAITADYKIARYDPRTDKVTVDQLLVDGKPMMDVVTDKVQHPDWRLAADGVTAYLQMYNDLRTFKVNLGGAVGQPATTVVSFAPITPNTIPITPPNRLKVMASMRNCIST